MAKRPFYLDDALDPHALVALGWPNKTAWEAMWFSYSIKPWIERFETQNGKIVQAISQDNPDDPPDVIVNFQRKSVSFEVTRLLPQKMGHFDKVVAPTRKNNFTVSPSLSGPAFESHDAMIHYALSLDGGWTYTENEVEAWRKEAATMLGRKIARARAKPFDYVVMHAGTDHINSLEAKVVVTDIYSTIQTSTGYCPSFILLLWTNHYHYESWHIRKDEELLYSRKLPQR